MEPERRRPHRAAAVVGLLVGVVLLLGAVLDGGLSTPTRTPAHDPATAEAGTDVTVARPAPSREDRGPWDVAPPLPLVPTTIWPLLLSAAGAALLVHQATSRAHRAPALLVARHRGPPTS